MVIDELIKKLNSKGESISSVAKTIPNAGEKKLRSAIKAAGFFYDQHKKKWININEEALKNLHIDIGEFIKLERERKNTAGINNKQDYGNKKEVQKNKYIGNNIGIESNTKEIFSSEEVAVLKHMAQQLLIENNYQEKRFILHQRIKGIKKEQRIKKTFAIKESLAKRINDFADENKYQLADVLEIALEDLLNRYNEDFEK